MYWHNLKMEGTQSFQDFISLQTETMQLMQNQMKDMKKQMENLSNRSFNNASSRVPFPKPLLVGGDIHANFQLFKANWETYIKATGIDTWSADKEPKKVNILLSMIGDAAKVKYNNFGLTNADMANANTNTVLSAISETLVKKAPMMYERWQFHSCNQLKKESFEAYLIRLNKILDNCQFEKIPKKDIKKILLRDRIAFGIRDSELKLKFLKEDPDKLTLNNIIDTCKTNEITKYKFKQSNSDENLVNKVARKRKTKKKSGKCKFCHSTHEFKRNICPARKHQCKVCSEKGHYDQCCHKSPNKQARNISDSDNEEEIEQDSSDVDIEKITDNSDSGSSDTAEN